MNATRTTAEILRAAKERIADQGHFVMGATAWNRQGRQVEPTSSDAWRWNARGAIYAESGIRPRPWKEHGQDHQIYQLLDRAARGLPHERVGAWGDGDVKHNCMCLHQVDDTLGHAGALQALEDAAILAEANESETALPAPQARDGGG
jgi:hypothetical protein